jgi:poly(3-hydroxybutyrate) depolymerase
MRSAGCSKPNSMVGTFQAQIRAFELDRGYYMSVPKTYDPERAHRLVFGYHGSNYTGMRMRQYLDNEKAPLLDGTIFVYPDGLPLPNQPDNIAWVLDAKGRDVAFFDALYDFVRSSYCIDETRVFVNGQSFGALMTNFIGCQRGDIIRAIAAVAGSGPRGTCQGKVAVWLTHGMEDMNVSFSSGEASRNFWRAANGCMDVTLPGDPPQCLRYQGCDPEHPVIWCPHVNDGGHQHPSFGRKAVRDFLAGF